MDDLKSAEIAEISADKLRIAELEAQIRKLQGANPTLDYTNAGWPIEEVVYLYGSKDDRRELGERIGLTDKARLKFKVALTKVEVKILINQDGSYKILEHDLK